MPDPVARNGSRYLAVRAEMAVRVVENDTLRVSPGFDRVSEREQDQR
jgi:hypothetical protein